MTKKKKLWTIDLNRAARWHVIPVTFVKATDTPDTSYYRKTFLFEGKEDTIVVDIKHRDIYENQGDALRAAINRCLMTSSSWRDQADELTRQLVQTIRK